jgi:histidinol-phosphate aminotransferase
MNLPQRMHGGPDALGPVRYDFSTNSNACGPCPQALAAVQVADAARYPDPSYTAVRAALADFHGVAPWRIVLAGSASEFIFRITAWARQQGAQRVSLPPHAYGDYAHAAQAWRLPAVIQQVTQEGGADLVWACEPSSPLGQAHIYWPEALDRTANVCANAGADDAMTPIVVLDRAYATLRLSGASSLNSTQLDHVWQLFSPNKALGLTGVRAAYALAPLASEATVQQLGALAPSWVLGVHGVALLTAWVQDDTQAWLRDSLQMLATWKQRQVALLQAADWTVQASETPFFCARPPAGVSVIALCAALRVQGIKLRDATSFGLPGWVRLGVLPPVAQDALALALSTFTSLENPA